MSVPRNPAELLIRGRPLTLANVADGAEALVVADLARGLAARPDATAISLAVLCRDGPRMGALARALKFFAPDLTVQEFPAWDCLPYDRVSPHAALVAQRMTVLSQLVRLDFFGNTLETIRSFDPETQRTTDQLRALDLLPVAEFQLTSETIRRFRLGYVEAFGAPAPDDVLYHAVSEGRRHPGMEHWLALFHDRLDSLFDYLTGCPIVLEPLAEDAVRERLHQIEDYYEARQQALAQRGPGPPYKPLSPQRLYFTEADWRARLDAAALVRLTPFKEPEGHGHLIDVGTKQGRNFAAERAEPGRNVFEAATRHVSTLKADGKRVIVALWSEGARERMCHVLADHGLGEFALVESWPQVLALPKSHVALTVLGIESGFETAE